MKLIFTKFVNLVPLEQCHHKLMGRYGGDVLRFAFPWVCESQIVMALLQWHMVYKLGEDELHRPPVVALMGDNFWLD